MPIKLNDLQKNQFVNKDQDRCSRGRRHPDFYSQTRSSSKKKKLKKNHTRAWIQFLSNPTNAGCLWLLSFKTNIIFFNYFYTITLEKSSPETWTHHTVPTGWVKLLMMSEKWEKWLRMLISGGLVPQLEHLSSADTTFCSDCSHHESPEVPPVSNVTLCLVVLGVGS